MGLATSVMILGLLASVPAESTTQWDRGDIASVVALTTSV